MALSILMITIGPAAAAYVSSARNTAVNRNRLIAAQLAQSGIDAMFNIRNTNLRRFSSKGTDCWNTKLEIATESGLEDGADSCWLAGNMIKGGSYRLIRDPATLDLSLERMGDIALPDTFAAPETSPYRLADTNFYREIFIAYSADGKTMKVKSTVFFRVGGMIYKVSKSANLKKNYK